MCEKEQISLEETLKKHMPPRPCTIVEIPELADNTLIYDAHGGCLGMVSTRYAELIVDAINGHAAIRSPSSLNEACYELHRAWRELATHFIKSITPTKKA